MTTTTEANYPGAYRDRAKAEPVVYGYLSSDGKSIRGFHGEFIGAIREMHRVDLPKWSYVHGSHYFAVRALMMDGTMRYGRSSPGISIALRAYADQDRHNAR